PAEGADTKGAKRAGKLEMALAVLATHPGWSDRRIAAQVGCSGAYLSKQEKWRAARSAIKGVGQEDKHRAGQNRGTVMDQYADRSSGSPKLAPVLCASKGCGDLAGRDADGNLLMHQGEPRCPECWGELRQGG